ncbi:MAG TPA: S8 family serine peptidase [Candidatus Baltobacteraceae bacterium]|nr:S8 family serine peptidase [Candidatus Baltobacteraceae bacterium]
MTPHATPSPAPTGAAAAFVCPASDSTFAATTGAASSSSSVRRMVARSARNLPSAPGLLAVTYDRSMLRASRATLVAREQGTGASLVREYDFPHANLVGRILAVNPAQQTQIENALRAMPGVRSVAPAGARRAPSAVTTPYWPNDPYFQGFTTTLPPTSGATAPPATFKVLPLVESAAVPGQWDMHKTQLEHAFGYAQTGNGSGITNAGALGSAGVKIAVIDTGEDFNQPELASKITYQKCFITNTKGVQSISSFTTDPDGHGTDVSGIAAADTNNAFGFTGAGGNVTIDAYRVFPTPDDNCSNPSTTDPQCSADTSDIVAAINDAVDNQHVNVINLSLGGGSCASGGVDPNPIEGAAIANALAANVVVVAASGNDNVPGKPANPIQAPACDNGVLAVGATSLADGQPNGTGTSSGNPSAPNEYVASYSNYGAGAAQPGNPAAWGIVAPGGDPVASGMDSDNLHWIEHIWTTTPFDAAEAGTCEDDYPSLGTTPPVDCRILIAGTSMSSPHVAGAAALIISAKPSYQSPSGMRQLLCQSADDIGDPKQGCGRLNVYRAMAAALADPSPPPSAP